MSSWMRRLFRCLFKPKMRVYDARNVRVFWMGEELTGFADGDFVTLDPLTEQYVDQLPTSD